MENYFLSQFLVFVIFFPALSSSTMIKCIFCSINDSFKMFSMMTPKLFQILILSDTNGQLMLPNLHSFTCQSPNILLWSSGLRECEIAINLSKSHIRSTNIMLFHEGLGDLGPSYVNSFRWFNCENEWLKIVIGILSGLINKLFVLVFLNNGNSFSLIILDHFILSLEFRQRFIVFSSDA